MKCIVGLGNPGKKYEKTRHNIGFITIDEILRRQQWGPLKKDKFDSMHTIVHHKGEKILFVQPQTYMNLSGKAVRSIIDFYGVNSEDVVVIYDDLDLPVGKIRLRQKGGHGGHNGIRSIIDHLGTKEFKRLRIGIGRPAEAVPIVDYVLNPFAKKELEAVCKSVTQAAQACEAWIEQPFNDVMNQYNTKD
ncbi:aminoacyl-tRNA hydrolase [Virgibacillus sp. W0430]|uniref:aminoacyl-tRNA hydrolase n=1 Tax=Virgibacillus sp. W0430 TaxID=3391580 RepID=UPI003F475DF9